MNNSPTKNYKSIQLNRYTWSLIISITITAIILIIFEIKKNQKTVKNIANIQALSLFDKDQAFRHWAALHGGVYVEVDSLTLPNPYLKHIYERDITTPSGKELTLMNPAYMVRQLNEYYSKFYGIGGHITSLNPLRPENKPDQWESNALKQFEYGKKEVSEFIEFNDQKYYRFMRPMIIKKDCLKCHGHQGYNIGDIRGGVSIMIPQDALIIKGKTELTNNIIPIIILWLLGIIFIIFSRQRLKTRINERDEAEDALIQRNMDLQAAEEEIRASNEELRVNGEELKETNIILAKAKKKAEENDRLKSAFLANISHEIRTPMNAILGFTGFLNDEDIDRNEKKLFINLIQSSTKQLLQIINDIVDISSLETNQLKLTKTKFGLNKFMDEINSLSDILLKTNEKTHIDLRIIKDSPSKEINIFSDINRLKQILLNLITNSIKFTKEGRIEIGYTIANSKVQFFVKDTGIGVSKEKHGVIFNRFVQLEDHLTREFGGTGIGLSICKGLVNLLDGNIWLTSEKGKGCSFYFDIPYNEEIIIKASDLKEMKDYFKYNFKNKTVLIVEDDESNYLFVKKLLENKKIKVLHSANGEQAIELCRLHKGIDLVLMDIQLPVLNGLEATKIIRSFNSEIPIIAQTAYAMIDDEKKCLDVGCNDYISKPIEHNTLFDKMNNLLN